MRGEVIHHENPLQRNRQMQQPAEVDGLRSLNFREHPDHPEEQENEDDHIPNQQHDLRRRFGQPDRAGNRAGDAASHRDDASGDDGEDGEERAESAAAAGPLVSGQAPAEPEDDPQLAPVHFSFPTNSASAAQPDRCPLLSRTGPPTNRRRGSAPSIPDTRACPSR